MSEKTLPGPALPVSGGVLLFLTGSVAIWAGLGYHIREKKILMEGGA